MPRPGLGIRTSTQKDLGGPFLFGQARDATTEKLRIPAVPVYPRTTTNEKPVLRLVEYREQEDVECLGYVGVTFVGIALERVLRQLRERVGLHATRA